MIQRVQTLHLGICIILMVLFILSPLFVNSTNQTFTALDCKLGLSFVGLYILLAVAAILQFKNRKLQVKIAWGAMACNAVVVFFYGVHYYFLKKGGEVSIRPGALIPVITMVFTYFAIHFINKDEKLVREADRLR